MFRARARTSFFVAGLGLVLLVFPACGKKASLRLVEDRVAEDAPSLRANIREERLTLDFKVPAHRSFPEREDPWVLARILRQEGPASQIVEVGAILEAKGFGFGSPLSWSDQIRPGPGSLIFRVEFRDGRRRRRAVSQPLTISWEQFPGAPPTLNATAHLRSVILDWKAPSGASAGVNYRIYRREASQGPYEQVTAEPVAETTYVDSRIESGRDYCYVVRPLLIEKNLEVEGPASPENCARAAIEQPPPLRETEPSP